MNIRKKFIIFSILWGIIPVIISTSICISNFNDKSIEMIKQNVAILASDQSTHLKSFFNENISNLKTDANIPMVMDLLVDSNSGASKENHNDNEKALGDIFSRRKKERFYISAELLINKNETIITSSDGGHINEKLIFSDEEIKKLRNDEAVVTDIIERKEFNSGVKSAIIASPIFFKNEYQGAIASVINMNYFEKLVNEIHFFKTGKMLVMDTKGVIAASNSVYIGGSIDKIDVSGNLYEKFSSIDLDKNPDGIIEYNIDRIEKIGYYSSIKSSGWVVLSGVEWNEFKTPINKSIENITVALFFIVLLIITSCTFIVNYFSKPIYKLLGVIRKIKQGDFTDRFVYNEDNEFGEIATAFNDLIDTIEKNKKNIEEKNRDLQSLTSNIPGGVYRFRIENGEYLLDFASSGCLSLLGYKKNEFKEISSRKLVEFIHEEDIERIKKEMQNQLMKSSRYNIEYRIKRRDGRVIWILDNGQIVRDREGKLFSYSVVINITESKVVQEKLRLSEERYRIIMSQTEDIIFEWNITEDTVYFSENWNEKFGYKSVIINISKNIYKTNFIHKNDIRKLGKMLNDIIYGDSYTETEIRVRKNENEYIWCKMRITAMFDEDGNIFKAIGIIIDIDKEKKEAEELLYKAQRDSLTGLYNKGTSQSIVEDYLMNEGKDINGALFVMDLDNFKAVNDNLGHLAGDIVLTEISTIISNVFQENSIIGRVGGDEFIIFLKNVNSEEDIRKKAEELISGFRNTSNTEILDHNVSGSIGIAKYPEHGKSYKELFISADKASYSAKNNGKGRYCIFNEN
ncbi:diguanylate cyclase domain-containing protein [Clostridium chromiireducens]|uniref:sensor domain-containing diguanylate cyclase n=1 Tax=Clostridium chromiireducens TaxID=225345 RepID=UPI003AF43108